MSWHDKKKQGVSPAGIERLARGDGVGQDHWHAVAISAMSAEPAYWMRKGYPFMRLASGIHQDDSRKASRPREILSRFHRRLLPLFV